MNNRMPSPEYIQKAGAMIPVLLQRIDAKAKPVTVPIIPEADAAINSCFYNVKRKVSKDGGEACYGWALRLTQHILEAEKHAIWLSPAGNYIDITPATHSEPYTAFVIDDEFVYQGQIVDNVR